eukprot:CAMPEP_0117423560 /NCGR_PEP_ID=MMETSP0758-20121206/4148_1 /TAXON_ID=63605 /ORGANISM="Percolomonas cosmopolitus, Strain AE-1 (ATCC 50343)" /LENGTH=105 /DNA_ID=CAMNT_0005206799 /DNA_START=28 /DNA_END=345 /DNA_ORIENTATION=-
MSNVSELACTYAALLLQDSGVEVSEANMFKVIEAAGIEVESYWPGIFCKFLKNNSLEDLLQNVGGSSGGAASGPSGDNSGETAQEEEEEEEEEESSSDAGLGGLF